MPQIKWTKEDVIKKFQEAVTAQPLNDQQDRQGILKKLIETAKAKRTKV